MVRERLLSRASFKESGEPSLVPRTERRGSLGATDCIPEIDTSKCIVDLQRHLPMDFQWQFPTELHFPVVCSKGLSLSQWIFAGFVHHMLHWHDPMEFHVCDFRCAIFCPQSRGGRRVCGKGRAVYQPGGRASETAGQPEAQLPL